MIHLVTYKFTSAVQTCVTWESNCHLSSERNLFHATQRFMTNVSITPSLDPILSQINPVHIHLIFFNNHFNITLLYTRYSLNAWDFILSWTPVLIPLFNLLWLVQIKLYYSMCLASWLPPLSCYSADHSQLSQGLYFIKQSWFVSCFMDWNSPSII